MVPVRSGAERPIDDFMLTGDASYLIAINGDAYYLCPKLLRISNAQAGIVEERMRLQARLDALDRLRESEKALSQNIHERAVDDTGFGRIRSKGETALSSERVQNNLSVRDRLDQRGIKPERLTEEDFKKTEKASRQTAQARKRLMDTSKLKKNGPVTWTSPEWSSSIIKS